MAKSSARVKLKAQAAAEGASRNGTGEKRAIWRPLVRTIVFVALAAALFVYLNMAFVMKGSVQNKGAYDAFYDLPENSLDVMYIGTSATSRFFVNPKAFNDYGIASFSIGSQNTPSYFIKHIMKETALTQKPKLYIIELRVIRRAPEKFSEGFVRTTLDTMNFFSPNRPEMVQQALRYCQGGSKLLDYYIPICKYHDRLVEGEMGTDDFLLKTPLNHTQGFCTTKLALSQTPQKPAVFTNETRTLDESKAEVLDDLLDYCETLDTPILFVLAPCSTSRSMCIDANTTEAYVERRGFTVLNCNNYRTCDVMGIDWETDFYNDHHTNYLGAEKYTDYLSKYLKSHYDLPDRRGDSTYDSWVEGYNYYMNYVKDGIKYRDSGSEGEE